MRGSGRNVQRLAQKAREYASESEAEEEKLPCDGFAICWESSDGPERLCRSVCTGVAQPFSMLLAEDVPVGKTSIGLCSEHAAQYLRTRYPNKCSHQDCNKVGFLGPQGLKLCTMHQSAVALSRPRSRSRSKSSEEPGEDPDEAEMEVDDENGGPEDTARNLLEAKQEEPVRKPRRSMSHSPGHTPKSSIHRSLAKIGLLDSPGSEGAPTLLQDFFEKFSEAKLMGWTEDTVRGHLQDNYELEPITFTDLDKNDKEQDELAIHVGEMLSFVAFACVAGERWRGTVVIYGGDNSIVKAWIQTRKAGVRAGKLLIRVVNLVEMRVRMHHHGGLVDLPQRGCGLHHQVHG